MNREDILAYIFAYMEDSVCLTGARGELLFMNAGAEKLFGCGSDWQNKKLWEIIPLVERNDHMIQLFIDAFAQPEKTVQALVDYQNGAGALYRLRVSITCGGDSEPVFIVVISDLTRLFQLNSAFVRYTSPEIADFVLNSPEGGRQGGQRKEVSILMSDLRGFTALSTRLSSEDLIRMLNRYFSVMAKIIARHRGTIIEFLGDGIFTVFGALVDLPSHAEAAVRCALEMEKAMEGVNWKNRTIGLPELEMGIGIHSGTATVGNIGSEQRMKFGCVGEAVNLAGRIESLTVGGQVLISESTLSLLPEKPEIQQVHSVLLKGEETAMRVFGISGLGNLHIQPLPEPDWQTLPLPVPFTFRVLDGKAAQGPEYPGQLERLSADTRDAWIRSAQPLAETQDLVLDAGGRSWAKVISVTPEGARLRFTFQSEAFGAWLADQGVLPAGKAAAPPKEKAAP